MCCALMGVTGEAIAQTSSASSTGQIAFDRPEAWAMKYFTSATALSGLSTPDSPIVACRATLQSRIGRGERQDVIVVGGGAVGASALFHLTRSGREAIAPPGGFDDPQA